MTRVSSGNSGIWLDICEDNAEAIVAVIDDYIASLGQIRDAIALDNRGEIRRLLEGARVARNRIPAKRGTDPSTLFEIQMPIPDKPGVFAEVTTLVGNQGINIEDLQLVHSSEGGQGLLHLVVSGKELAERAAEALAKAGYSARLHPL
jgi:prephenate dehydrogenase